MSVMNHSQFQQWCRERNLPVETIDLLARIRFSQPVRRVQGRAGNAMEAASGEQELRYTASRRQYLWHLLVMTTETEEQQTELAPPITPLQHGHPSQRLRMGEPKPQRYEVGEPKKEERAERCSFSNQTLALSPAQLTQAGVTKCQCPLCGAIWTARIRGEGVSFPPHQSPQKARVSTIPRWVRQGTIWTLT